MLNRFDEMYNVAEIAEESKKEQSGDFEDVPTGDYCVCVPRLLLTESKSSGKPMVTAWFEVTDGKYKGKLIFMNQVIEKGFQVKIVNNLLRALETSADVEFKNFSQYENLLDQVWDECFDNEYHLVYGRTNKGFNTFKIVGKL